MKTILLFWLLGTFSLAAQPAFNFQVELQAKNIPDFPSLHSFAFGQHEQYWVFFGGRVDGIHARQPFNAFPATGVNTNIWLVDTNTDSVYSLPSSSLPDSVYYQMQGTNFNFIQEEEYLFIAGGYGIWLPSGLHTTFPLLTRIHLPTLIQNMRQQQPLAPAVSQVHDSLFAITGGQLGKINHTYLLVGGHYFEGRYNPMGPNHGPGFIQSYSNQIRKFTVNADSLPLQVSPLSTVTDATHLHRRDYNLVPQIFPNGEPGYMLSAGVFQHTIDLPFLYPVDIRANSYQPRTDFNQLLSHYHSAKVALYDSASKVNHSLYFGGLAQYFLDSGGQLVQDNNAPFVNTISRVTRSEADSLYEFKEAAEMPVRVGASAEFLVNKALPSYANEVLMLDAASTDTIELGYVVGGISSPVANAFTNNNTGVTSASGLVYRVRLVPSQQPTAIALQQVPAGYDLQLSPNPSNGRFEASFDLQKVVPVHYVITALDGSVVEKGSLSQLETGTNYVKFDLRHRHGGEPVVVTFVFDYKHFVSKKLLLRK